jgi:hypothetical protein
MNGYHHKLLQRADAAVATGNIFAVLVALRRDAIVWMVPALLAVLICCVFRLSGSASLWVTLPLVGISLAGGVIYVGAVYAQALSRRANGS